MACNVMHCSAMQCQLDHVITIGLLNPRHKQFEAVDIARHAAALPPALVLL